MGLAKTGRVWWASFGAIRLMALASEAVTVAPGDATTIAKLKRAIERL